MTLWSKVSTKTYHLLTLYLFAGDEKSRLPEPAYLQMLIIVYFEIFTNT